MPGRMRNPAQLLLLATVLAVVGFGASGLGVFGPPSTTTAILETTAQSPIDVLPHPSPGVVPPGPAAASRPYETARSSLSSSSEAAAARFSSCGGGAARASIRRCIEPVG